MSYDCELSHHESVMICQVTCTCLQVSFQLREGGWINTYNLEANTEQQPSSWGGGVMQHQYCILGRMVGTD